MEKNNSGLLRFHHIGIAVNNINETAQFYIDSDINNMTGDYILSEIKYDPIQDVYIAFLDNKLMPRIELVQSGSDKSPVCKIIERQGTAPYHICYSVDNIDDAVKKLRIQHFLPLSYPVPAAAMDNKKICFLFKKTVGLIELVEDPK